MSEIEEVFMNMNKAAVLCIGIAWGGIVGYLLRDSRNPVLPEPIINSARHYMSTTYLSQFDSDQTSKVPNGIYKVEHLSVVGTGNGPTFSFVLSTGDAQKDIVIWGPSGFRYPGISIDEGNKVIVTNGTIKAYFTPQEIADHLAAYQAELEKEKQEQH